MVSYVEDGLYGCDPEVLSSPVLRVCVHAFLQDVEFSAEPRLLKGHPPATTTSQEMKPQPPCFHLHPVTVRSTRATIYPLITWRKFKFRILLQGCLLKLETS